MRIIDDGDCITPSCLDAAFATDTVLVGSEVGTCLVVRQTQAAGVIRFFVDMHVQSMTMTSDQKCMVVGNKGVQFWDLAPKRPVCTATALTAFPPLKFPSHTFMADRLVVVSAPEKLRTCVTVTGKAKSNEGDEEGYLLSTKGSICWMSGLESGLWTLTVDEAAARSTIQLHTVDLMTVATLAAPYVFHHIAAFNCTTLVIKNNAQGSVTSLNLLQLNPATTAAPATAASSATDAKEARK
jgi:hypothetical protein